MTDQRPAPNAETAPDVRAQLADQLANLEHDCPDYVIDEMFELIIKRHGAVDIATLSDDEWCSIVGPFLEPDCDANKPLYWS